MDALAVCLHKEEILAAKQFGLVRLTFPFASLDNSSTHSIFPAISGVNRPSARSFLQMRYITCSGRFRTFEGFPRPTNLLVVGFDGATDG